MNIARGGKEVSVTLATGETQAWFVRLLPLKDYDAGFKLEDEFSLTAHLCKEKKVEDVYALDPASYESLREETEKLNASFFAYCDRQRTMLYDRLNRMKPEMVDRARARVLTSSSPASVVPVPR